MSYLLYAFTALLVLDALRMRGRIGKLAVLAPTDAPATHRAIAAPGVTIDDATLRAASAYMRAEGLEVLDLVPRDVSAIGAMTIAQLVDPARYRADRLQPGRTAGHAIVVSEDVYARAQPGDLADAAAFAHVATRLKLYGKGDLAIADVHARPADPASRFDVLRAMIGPSTAFILAALPVMWTLLGLGIVFAPVPGLIALGAWQLQPALALPGSHLPSRDWPLLVVFRFPIELWILLRTLFMRRASPSREATYAALLKPDTFFEPRRETCLICESPDLRVHLRTGDLFQHKPGRFTLERCRACSHIFQNPRLSLDGLDYYYKDFYDGLGEAGMEFVFGYGSRSYHDRARMVRAVAPPKTWLDVGAGHGHFCIAAREDLPDTKFDGLDLSESIDEAKRRGWIDTAYRGLFPDLAPSIAGRYDAVSMSHYLEHTLDPRAEIAAAHTALAPGGCLMIEVPDPEFFLGKLLGRLWLPWFQPQHLNLLSVANLEKLLRERGFEPVEWHRGKAHQRVDIFFATYIVLDQIAPPTRLPWRRRGWTAWRIGVWAVGSPLIFASLFIDNVVLGPLLSRAKVSNTYRVVARKTQT